MSSTRLLLPGRDRAPGDALLFVLAAGVSLAGEDDGVPDRLVDVVLVEIEDGEVDLILLQEVGLFHLTVHQPGDVASLPGPAAVELDTVTGQVCERETQTFSTKPVPAPDRTPEV